MRTKLLMLLICLKVSFWTSSFAIADDLEEYTVKAALSLNFARFTEWPKDVAKPTETKIMLCTLGDNVIQEAFSGVENKMVGNKVVMLINLSRIRDMNHCHLLFVSGLEKNKTIQLMSEISQLPILTIGEDPDFLKNGGMVILNIVGGKVSMEINLEAVKKAKLQINSRVLKLASIYTP